MNGVLNILAVLLKVVFYIVMVISFLVAIAVIILPVIIACPVGFGIIVIVLLGIWGSK